MTNTNTVAELAVAMPQAIPVLERLKIDYCCKGRQPIEQACSRAGITTDQLLSLIEGEPAAGETRSWDDAPLQEIVAFILRTHHAYTRATLDTLQQLAAKVATRHGPHHPELVRVQRLVAQLQDDLMPHMMKEEQILFPYFDQLEPSGGGSASPFGTVRNPIRMMMMEHEAAGELVAEIRAATNDFALPADACTSFTAFYKMLAALEDDLHRHIHLENNVLFPRAIAMESAA
ncbi:MAG TPA: iron-sulfur cluster repair di-iron protein [Thermoanaerobaculia bacterium]|jgi:regulator of cell morphogenesis and NO signaling|nr:iron-sulfur cluster repair di-iron protein [Thermoanaerobaculia bacterium]